HRLRVQHLQHVGHAIRVDRRVGVAGGSLRRHPGHFGRGGAPPLRCTGCPAATSPSWWTAGAHHSRTDEHRRYPWLPTATSAARDRPSDTPSRTRTAAPSVVGTRTSSAFGPRWATP